MNADYNVTLEHNDAVQTTGEGIAKVVFTDGTSYTIKPDSLIVIQENSVTATVRYAGGCEVNHRQSRVGHAKRTESRIYFLGNRR